MGRQRLNRACRWNPDLNAIDFRRQCTRWLLLGDNSQHINFIDRNGHLHELCRNPNPLAQWVDNDLTKFAGGTPASIDSALDGYSLGDNSQHVNFIDGNGHVHELYRNPDPAAQWVDNDLTKFAGTSPIVGISAIHGYSLGDNSQHVNFIDGNGHVHELYRNPDPAAQWVDNDLTEFAGGTPAVGIRELDGYSLGDNSQHVNFIDGNGHVHELYRNPDPAAQWVDNDLTQFAGTTPAVGIRELHGYSQADNSQHVNFIDANGHVHELYRNPDPAAQWVDNDLTKFAGETQAVGGRHSMGTHKATTASTSITLTGTGMSTSCTGIRIRQPNGWTTT